MNIDTCHLTFLLLCSVISLIYLFLRFLFRK
jgi:hypothetical protein